MIVAGPPEIDSMGIRDLIRSQDFVIVYSLIIGQVMISDMTTTF